MAFANIVMQIVYNMAARKLSEDNWKKVSLMSTVKAR